MHKKDTILLKKKDVVTHDGVVVLSLKEYERLCKHTVPTYYLLGMDAKKSDLLVEEGLRQHRTHKTKKITSFLDLS
ncbi:MAG: hypothetical protein Q7S16_04540 [bacterium]|nr:hypothetical protein [bacterium]